MSSNYRFVLPTVNRRTTTTSEGCKSAEPAAGADDDACAPLIAGDEACAPRIMLCGGGCAGGAGGFLSARVGIGNFIRGIDGFGGADAFAEAAAGSRPARASPSADEAVA